MNEKAMNEKALKHIDDNLEAYNTVIKSIFAVKGLGHGKNSFAGRINIGVSPIEYVDSLRLVIQKLTSTFKKIAKNDLEKVVFELDEYFLILRRKSKTKNGTPLFLSIIATKTEGLEYFDTIIEELSEELFLLLR